MVNIIRTRPSNRIYGYCADKLHQNFTFIFDKPPTKNQLNKSTIVSDIIDVLEHKYDRDKLSLRLPEAFDQLAKKEVDIEVVKTNTL